MILDMKKFSQSIKNTHFRPKKDAILILSASGNSKILLNWIWVKKNKGTILSIVGFDGGKIKEYLIHIFI